MNGFYSNTLAASSNQSWFAPEAPGASCTGRAFFRLYAPGEYRYRFFFTNMIDSTYADGSHSRANRVMEPWRILAARCAVCSPADANAAIESWQSITFDGAPEKAVAAGERFASDPVRLNAPKSVWLCFEITFEGTKLPYLEEAIIPLFREENGRFVPSKKLPLPAMIACDRPVFKKIAFLGDSITEGIGTPIDSYAHWAARVADKMGDSYGYWNLGIGFARASDAASDGAWLAKARKADLVNVCLGVNDILHGQTTVEALKAQLALILRLLKEAGCQVGLFTVPPCDGPLERGAMWREVNRFIREELAPQADYVFDVTQIWGGFPVDPSRYGGLHPNAAGCEALAEAYVRDAKIQSVWRSSI